MVFNATFNSYIVAVSYIGEGIRIEDPEKTTDLSQVTDKF